VRKEAELLDLAHDAIVVREEGGKILFWSNGAAEMYGWTREEAVGRKMQEILKTVFPVPFKRIMDDTFSQGRWEGELMHTRKNGEQLIVLSRWALRISASGRPEIMEVNSNISTRKEIEEALKQTVLYNRSLIEANLDPLVTIGPEGKITDVNASTEKATGFSRNELIGTDFSDYFTDPGKARAGYEKVFREGIVRDYELVIKHKDGQTTPVFYNASIYKDSSGNIAGVFAAARDVTERKQTEKELKEKSRVLEELNTALKVLINRYKNDEKEFEERITSSIRMGITPYIAKLKETRQDVRQSAITEIIESTLEDITSPFFKAISSEHFRFSPKEIEIISYIRQGKTTKEMAQLLGLGKRTIDSYRDNIRNKLGLSSKKINLRTYLLSIINT
jgi:PAS domain S-box-containing protein